MSKLFKILICLHISVQVFAQDYYNIKKATRVAIYSVEDKSNTAGQYTFDSDLDQVILELMIAQLVKSGNFTIVDRQQIEAVMNEQGLQQSGLVTEQTAITLGKMLGVQLGIFGVINQFEIKAAQKEGLESLIVRAVTDNEYMVEHTESTALVGLGIKIIDIKTGEIIIAEEAKTKQSIKRYGDEGFTKEVISKSAEEAVNKIIKKIEIAADSIPWEARVASVLDNGQIIINSGQLNGIQNDMEFEVYGVGEEIIDPTTGLSLGVIESLIGKIRVINSELGSGKASMCEVISGKGTASINDMVRIPPGVPMPVYKFKHETRNSYLFTTEKYQSKSWEFKAIAFKAVVKQIDGVIPIYIHKSKKNKYYRLSNKDFISEKWSFKGLAFYAFSEQKEGLVPIYEFRHAEKRHYLFTKNSEKSSKWKEYGVSFYAYP